MLAFAAAGTSPYIAWDAGEGASKRIELESPGRSGFEPN